MSIRKVSLAIISDLHCQPSNCCSDETYSNDSYLKTDLLRDSISDHPVESLLHLIRKDEIKKVDFTLCPGDFTNKSSKQGFVSGWDFSLEIHRELESQDILATLGNHDADSFGSTSSYSLTIARGIRKGFPLSDNTLCETFWANGCAFVEKEDCRFLVINSSHFHHNKSEAGSGRIDDVLLEYVKDYLSKNNDDKIKIAMAHHHPIDHSRMRLGEEDKIVNADDLLKILGENLFDLFIHGHKHDPLLRYHYCTGTSHKIPILSSGSFSAISNLSWTSQRNTFHRLEITKDGNAPCVGKIRTWTFMPRSGWIINSDDNGFHPFTGFGYHGTLEDLMTRVIQEIGDEIIKQWAHIVGKIPEVSYLTPEEAITFQNMLRERGYTLSPKISENPEDIYNKNSTKISR